MTLLDALRKANLPSRIASALTGSFVLLTVTVGIAMALMASSENRQVAAKTRALVQAAVTGHEDSLRQFAVDYFNWTAVIDALEARDEVWLFDNIGLTAVSDVYAQHLILISEPDGTPLYGWIDGGGEAPRTDVLPPEVARALHARHGELAPDRRDSVLAYATIGGEFWMLATVRVAGNDGPAGMDPAEMYRAIMGFRIDDGTFAALGEVVFVDDVNLVPAMPDDAALDALALSGIDGEPVAWVAWPRPVPGWTSLMRVLPAVLAVLAVVALINLLAGRAVAQGARRLERALVAARAADVAKSEFLTNMSHELRTPISGIAGMAEILSLEELTPDQAELVDLISSSAKAQMTLVSDVMNVSRLEDGTRELERAPFDPAREVRMVAGLLRPQAVEKGIELGARTEGAAIPMLVGDAGAFRQIVTNLVGNAVKFTEAGSIDVSTRIEGTGPGAALVVRVSDTGPGIPHAERRRIFERFTQVDESSTREKGGSGLGLAISQGLAGLMGGAIRVVDAPPPGSTFELRIPARLADMPLATAA